MKVRQAESADFPRIQQLFEQQGFAYQLPDRREFVAGQVVEDEHGVVMAILARPTVELYMLADPTWKTPAMRFEALRKIHESMRLELRAKGFHYVHVWIPPQKKSFVQRLKKSFGWVGDGSPEWTCLTRSTEARVN